MNVIDLTNKVFGKLTVLHKTKEKGPSKWNCACECGKLKDIRSYSLLKGFTKSCGCVRITTLHKGEKYGRLTILEPNFEKNDENRLLTKCECECECGTVFISSSYKIKSGGIKSCGCGKKGINSICYKGYKGLSSVIWNGIKSNAQKRNYEFSITMEYAWNLLIKQNYKCALSGTDIKLKISMNEERSTASLDRIDSKKGYVEGNVQWVHKDVNFMKQDFSQSEFINYCKLIAKMN